MIWDVILDTWLKDISDHPRRRTVSDGLKGFCSIKSNTNVPMVSVTPESCSSKPTKGTVAGGTEGADAREKVSKYSMACRHTYKHTHTCYTHIHECNIPSG